MKSSFLNDPIMKDALQVKYDLAAENDMDISKVAKAIHQYNSMNPPPSSPPSSRKLISGHPIGRSISRHSEAMEEITSAQKMARPRKADHPKSKNRPASRPAGGRAFKSAARDSSKRWLP